ncbi:MAG: hypothetical protein FWD11_08095, partial [Micrococcales bacterium]|nr:hypothetical protein [Micrococcales bacterium]
MSHSLVHARRVEAVAEFVQRRTTWLAVAIVVVMVAGFVVVESRDRPPGPTSIPGEVPSLP